MKPEEYVDKNLFPTDASYRRFIYLLSIMDETKAYITYQKNYSKGNPMVVQNKCEFLKILKDTKREGIDLIINYLDSTDFFTAPASTKYHGCYDGGLCEHCLNVYHQAVKIYEIESEIKPKIKNETSLTNVIISSLLHDVCKCNAYKKVQKWRKNLEDKWEKYDTYEHVYLNTPVGHGEKSVIDILRTGFKLEENEILAIRWHMSAFDLSDYSEAKQCFNVACDKTSLVSIIACADNLATRITENC